MRGILFICLLSEVSGFLSVQPYLSCLKPCKDHSRIILYQSKGNMTKTNNTKIMKLDFTEETEEEQLFRPRYAFGLSEYDMILLRIYTYMVITIHFVLTYLENVKKMIQY